MKFKLKKKNCPQMGIGPGSIPPSKHAPLSPTPKSRPSTMTAHLLLLPSTLSSLTLTSSPSTRFSAHPQWAPPRPRRPLPPIRMGGGPRTYPGGVSKWQWKRMQAKKSKQLLKARLLRERQVYETRKRAELKAAVSELEKPWELVEKAPNLFSVSADEQVKALADRFQKPGGFDMWSERDGPRVFGGRGVDSPSRRFFPKGAVHSLRPYGAVEGGEEEGEGGFDDWVARGRGGVRRRRRRREGRQGVRLNADERGDGSLECVDVEGGVVDENGDLGLDLGGNGEDLGGGSRRISVREGEAEKSRLRPGAGSSSDDGRKWVRDGRIRGRSV